MQHRLFIFIALFNLFFLHAQDEETPLQLDTSSIEETLIVDESLMQEIKEKSEFDYERSFTEESWWDDFTNWLSQKWNQLMQAIFGDIQTDSFVYLLTQILPYLIVIGVVIFIFWLFIKLNPGQNVLAETKKNQIFFSDEEELVKTKDLAKLKAEALENRNYRLAVRYWYLQTLQKLDKLELIEYQFEKTNTDYAEELKAKPFAESFKQTTNFYNFAWYGGFDVNEIQFQKINQLFNQLHERINQKNE
ncbi:DUF4129 domain-containing protein [Psychroflexus planctonicus]|uniref:Protein-glutamine gamma-glutamyltransferase-like C-terminal domain-containing protein n=1 Tax=Psychroflexus planctonicus TaxID=1526575 RepID=A0ABQ1SLT3_9FLAO|nr:DUF4129 domain-containing protein [Psychroflexus planctonicus]GGE43179.1 hypothetical protein GCM10010832_23900 [Psychroflexus planctonicus]